MRNDISEFDARMKQLMEINTNIAGNVNAVSAQLGMVVQKVDGLGLKIENIENRMQTYEDSIRVSRTQADTIRRAIHARACEILDIKYKDGVVVDESLRADTLYRPGFISKIYSDARKYSVLGTPYYETARKDYGEVLDYINGWLPMHGITGYKEYLDQRRRIRKARENEEND